jgi:cell wall-associated NlpC family hydrolase
MTDPDRPRRSLAPVLGGALALVLVVAAVLLIGGRGKSPAPAASADATGAGGAGGAGSVAAATKTRSHRPRGVKALATTARGHGKAPEVADPEAAQSFPLPAGAPAHAAAITPAQAALLTTVSPGAPSDAEVRAELQQMAEAEKAAAAAAQPGTIGAAGTVTPPKAGPEIVARVIAGANAIATFPYVYGGGHASFVDTAYDCSGSVSYALAAAGLVGTPLTSGDLESWGVPGPGKYISVYANAGHTFMYVDGLRYDTSGRSGIFGTRWQTAPRTLSGFVVRHWPGL